MLKHEELSKKPKCTSWRQYVNRLNSKTPVGEWSGGAMVLGKRPVPGRPTIWIQEDKGLLRSQKVRVGFFLDIFTLIYPFSPLSPSLLETAQYRLKYCLKGPLNPTQPTNQNPSQADLGHDSQSQWKEQEV